MQQAYSWQWVEAQVAQTIEVWHGSASQPARAGPQYCLKQQRESEQAYDAVPRAAARLGPARSAPDRVRPCRSAWPECGLQPLLGEPVALPPSILGYSLL